MMALQSTAHPEATHLPESAQLPEQERTATTDPLPWIASSSTFRLPHPSDERNLQLFNGPLLSEQVGPCGRSAQYALSQPAG